jgi:phage-related tail protein
MDRAGERTTTRDTDELLAEVETTTDEAGGDATAASDDPTMRERAGDVFSVRAFLVALALTAVGVVLGGFVPLLGAVLRYVGVFAATFALGAASERRHYLEAGLAGALVPTAGTLLEYFALTVAGVGIPVIAIAAGVGLLAGLAGHYFGRDLRDGLTREL